VSKIIFPPEIDIRYGSSVKETILPPDEVLAPYQLAKLIPSSLGTMDE
jgi:hypothetical protein